MVPARRGGCRERGQVTRGSSPGHARGEPEGGQPPPLVSDAPLLARPFSSPPPLSTATNRVIKSTDHASIQVRCRRRRHGGVQGVRSPPCAFLRGRLTAPPAASCPPQLNIGHVDASGVYTGQYSTMSICGFLRQMVRLRREARGAGPAHRVTALTPLARWKRRARRTARLTTCGRRRRCPSGSSKRRPM